jgi:acyl-coenzyme A thioesterase PaaI-like protein
MNKRRAFLKAGLAVGSTAALSRVVSAAPTINTLTHAKVREGYDHIPRLAGYADLTSPDNEKGLPMELFQKDGRVHSWVAIPEHFAGWKAQAATYAHDGAVTTVLTTVSGFQAMVAAKQPVRNASSSFEFVAPAATGEELHAEASVTARPNQGQYVIEAEIRDSRQRLLAKSKAVWQVYAEFDDPSVDCPPAALQEFRQKMVRQNKA